MASNVSSQTPGKTYRPIHTIDELRESLVWALCGELSVIPPYLCALYSLKDPTSEASLAIRSVVIEEMLHMMQVANLLNAIGGCPSLDEKSVPSYPGYILHHAVGGPFIQLQAYSALLAGTVFVPIEQPDIAQAMPAPGKPFDSVYQFYRAIKEGFETCVKDCGEGNVFPKTRPQLTDIYFGPGGGRLIAVTGLASAKLAIREITEQGEGAFSPRSPTLGAEPFGGYEHYGIRPDDTYGPIEGTGWEMSHYRKFKQLANAQTPAPAVYPMQINPSAHRFSGLTKELANLFNRVYTLMLKSLENLFKSGHEGWFFAVGFPLMRYALQPLAVLLMQTPLIQGPGASAGPTAGPPFAFDEVPDAEILALTESLAAASPGDVPSAPGLWRATLSQVRKTLDNALKAKAKLPA